MMVTSIIRAGRNLLYAAIGTSAFILGFAIQSDTTIPFIALILFAGLSLALEFRKAPPVRPAGLVSVLVFVVSFGLSTLVSINLDRSLVLSASLVPAGLLYFLVAGQFSNLFHVRMMAFSFCLVSILLSMPLVLQVLANPDGTPTGWIADLESPFLVVPNDMVFLAVAAPISLALFRCERNYLVKATALLAIAASVIAICLSQSRTGVLTMVISLGVCAWFFRPRFAAMGAAAIVGLGLLVDGLLGFPLLGKFGDFAEPRFSLWLAAWSMFLDAPWLGHGPHSYGLLVNSYLRDLQIPDWPILNDRVVPWPADLHSPWAHNLYLETLAAQGIFGLFALLGVLATALHLGWMVRKSANEYVRFYGTAVFSGLLGFSIAGLYELSFLRIWVAVVMFAYVAILACIYRFHSTNADEPV